MKTQIAKTDAYSLYFSPSRNRIYSTIRGSWNVDTMQKYFEDWKAAIANTKDKFTLITDIRLMQPHSQEVQRLHEDIQRYALSNGLLQVAVIASTDDIVDLQAYRTAQNTGVSRQKFQTMEEAEEFLNRTY